MKILFLTDLYPIKKDEKNMPKTLYSFVQDWRKLGHSVDVIKPNFVLNSFLRQKPYYPTGQYKSAYNANYITPFCGDIKNKLPELDYSAYDVIIAHMPSGIIASNHFDGKLVCGVHCSDIEVLTNPLYSIYFKPEMEKAYDRAIGIACRSIVLRKKFLNLYPQYENKTFVAPSGINIQPIRRKATSMRKKDVLNIVTCANLIKRKNIDKLIKVANDNEHIRLTVIGEGKEFKSLVKIANKVKFTGYLPKDLVLEEMQNSDIFILPSVKETFGMVYLEAMAMGCITVCTKDDGIDGIIKDGWNGFLTKPDSKSIKEVLSNISNMDEGQIYNILQNCYNTVIDYDSTTCAEKYMQNILKNI